ncbi:hypothetical protein EAO05_02060 [Klebsiella pneumoniae]|nr:hypothetical protein EAO05_02060 [Klebsiella pneumoniae]
MQNQYRAWIYSDRRLTINKSRINRGKILNGYHKDAQNQRSQQFSSGLFAIVIMAIMKRTQKRRHEFQGVPKR